MWFGLSLVALFFWSGSDLFSKIGCRDARDKYAHLKMVMAVGAVMSIHACYKILMEGVEITASILMVYLPVAALYIFSMALGYVGLRYIELSISSPICNSSGALVAVLSIAAGGLSAVTGWQIGAVALVCAGVIGLGIVESHEDEALRAARQEASNYKYAKSWLALALPVAYCLLDAAGTFMDSYAVEKITALTAEGTEKAGAASANAAYELTFLIVGAVSFVYVVIVKKDKLIPRAELPKFIGALFETVGQSAYIVAIADRDHIMFAAPIISAYCVASMLWSRLFLKERLSWKHYFMIALVVAGIVILGVFDT